MHRIPLTVRALVMLPFLAMAVDHARVSVFCERGARSCLEAAGGGGLGRLGAVVLLAYAGLLAIALVRFASRGRRRLTCTATLLAALGGQAALAALLGDGGALGGGWVEILPACLLGGALLAGVLRLAPAAVALVRRLRARAPRLRPAAVLAGHWPQAPARRFSPVVALAAAGRAPPLTLGQP